MYCPKCGKENPEDGRYCRKCGTGLGSVPGADSSHLLDIEQRALGKVASAFRGSHATSRKKKKDTWEGAMGSLFTGVAFLVITGVLAFQPMGTGWWFWLFIPAFSMIGAGVAKIIRLEKGDYPETVEFSAEGRKQVDAPDQSALPPKQTTYASEFEKPRYDTGKVAPPSVTEDSTRLLEIDPDGETTKLPRD